MSRHVANTSWESKLRLELADAQQLIKQLTEALERYVNAYAGNKAAMLGNGQARRSLDEFKELLAAVKQREQK